MPRSDFGRDDNEQPTIRALPWYGFAVILVAVYVNTYDIWRWLIANAGNSAASVSPFAITATALAIAFLFARRGGAWPALVLGAAIALAAR